MDKSKPTTPAHHPTQPLYVDKDGILRFRPNILVRYLLDAAGQGQRIDMNALAILPGVSAEEHAHFAQLIGYSVSGWGDISFVNEGCSEWLEEVDAAADVLRKETP